MPTDTFTGSGQFVVPSGIENIIVELVRGMAKEWYDRPSIINEIFQITPIDPLNIEFPLDLGDNNVHT